MPSIPSGEERFFHWIIPFLPGLPHILKLYFGLYHSRKDPTEGVIDLGNNRCYGSFCWCGLIEVRNGDTQLVCFVIPVDT